MTEKFKAYDEVRRITGRFCGMVEGDTDTVFMVVQEGVILTKYQEGMGAHDASCFELVEEVKTTVETKGHL